VVFAGAGNDFVFGGDGDDWLSGEDGDDNLLGEAGNDTILGGGGSDAAFGGTGNDTIWGGDGADLVDGGVGDDYLSGGGGDDVIVGGQGSDTIEGEAGDDVVVATAFDGDDQIDGGDGIDTYDISGTSADALIDLTLGLASSTEIGNDFITSFENARGGGGDDIIVDNGVANKLAGNGGNDVFVFLESSKNGKGGHIRDQIEDFEVGDKIDLAGIDGNTDEEGWQRLVFNFDEATSFDHVGQAIYRYEDNENKTVTLIQFNFHDNGDDEDAVDYEIAILGRHELDDTNIIT
jgi:Ca2+-binding RTX toxin-like protein